MAIIELFYLMRLWLVMAQLVYWALLRDNGYDEVVWEACLYPGRP